MSQLALVLNAIGKPLVLQSRPIPDPKEGEILLKVLCVGLNPHDQKIRDQGLIIGSDNLPYIPGNDIAGIVERLGPEVSGFHADDRIFAQADTSTIDGGGLQQYAIIQAEMVAKIPPDMSEDEAATLPTCAMAAFVALFHPSGLGLPPPFVEQTSDHQMDTLVVIGGGSNCGKMAIQFAKLAGFGTIVTLAAKTGTKERELRDLGATHVVDRHASNAAETVRNIVGDNLIYAIDTVNGGENAHNLGVTLLSNHVKGTLVTLLPGTVDPSIVGVKEAGYEVKFSIGNGFLHRDLGSSFWKQIQSWLETSRIRPLSYQVIDGLDAEQVNAMLDAYGDGTPISKINVHPHPLFSQATNLQNDNLVTRE